MPYALALGFTEVGLGSLLHAFHVPLAGQLLSLNQIYILTRAARASGDRREAAAAAESVSLSAALWKAYAPAGKKLTPMLAIAAQGLLFSGGVRALGRSRAGVALGAVLSSVWAFLQPFAIAWVAFGDPLLEWVHRGWFVVVGAVALKVAAAFGVALAAWRGGDDSRLARWSAGFEARGRVIGLGPRDEMGVSPVGGALRDVLSPLYLVGLAITAVVAFTTDPSALGVAKAVGRPLAVGFFVFLALRSGRVRRAFGQLVARRQKLSGHAHGDLGGVVAPEGETHRRS